MIEFWKVEKRIARHFKCITTALVLADFIGKENVLKKNKRLMKGGWFYYNVEDIEENLLIGRKLRRKCIKALIEEKFLTTKKETTTLNRTHYKVDHAIIASVFHEVLKAPHEVPKSLTSEVPKGPTSEVPKDPTYKKNIIRNNNKNITPIVPADIVDLWNRVISFKRAMGLPPKRKKAINALLKDFPEIEKWKEVFGMVESSSFLSGKTKKPWKGCNLDWCINPNNWIKILEGNYNDNSQTDNTNTALKLIAGLGGSDNANF